MSRELVKEYRHIRQHHQKNSPLCFRDVVTKAEQLVEAKQRAEEKSSLYATQASPGPHSLFARTAAEQPSVQVSIISIITAIK